ncbi:lycopene cyclase family protein [Corynebacterium bovis]|uniref:lycopene cyclase family protein n=1 Tax=Corynebacterium bovis TaxID=36808 RepID=UPI00244A9D50|nr:lycopene cyclase family protein [Corynebacterium bovis]MDH2454978.1 lycopene cyclase family protein [Corynebacterium bovis]
MTEKFWSLCSSFWFCTLQRARWGKNRGRPGTRPGPVNAPSTPSRPLCVAVLGAGPAGAAVARRALERGWTVHLHDPRLPRRADALPQSPQSPLPPQSSDGPLPRWPATYGVLVDECPGWLDERPARLDGDPARPGRRQEPAPPTATAPTHPRVRTPDGEVSLPHRYAMVDADGLRARLAPGPGAVLHRDAPTGTAATPAALGVDAVIDCTGAPDVAGGVRQVAVGVHVTAAEARALGHDRPVFMDWTPAPGVTGADVPSFLYVQPLDGGRTVLFEETVLATRESARELVPVLRRRLHARLGLPSTGPEPAARRREVVDIPMGTRRRPWYRPRDGVWALGAAGGMVHPATGYSLAAGLAAVDTVLDAVPRGRLPRRLRLSAALAWWLRRLGGDLLTRADGDATADFFAAFFRLPARRQWDYLTGHDGVAVAAAMWALRRTTGLGHPFLRPVWRRPWSALAALLRDGVNPGAPAGNGRGRRGRDAGCGGR